MLESITWFKHSAFCWDRERRIYVDPWGLPEGLPAADVILITHPHDDHLSPWDVAKVRRDRTLVFGPAEVAARLDDVNVVTPGDAFEVLGYSVDAVPAYNLHPDRLEYHPKDRGWVGYVFTIDGTRYYHAGDTDHIPEMDVVDCDVAFLPIGGTFTMDVAEAAEAARAIGPKVVVPMHFGFLVGASTDGRALAKALAPLQVHMFMPRIPFER